jgi:hypothetical protein
MLRLLRTANHCRRSFGEAVEKPLRMPGAAIRLFSFPAFNGADPQVRERRTRSEQVRRPRLPMR